MRLWTFSIKYSYEVLNPISDKLNVKSLRWHPVYRCSGEVSAHANCYLSPPSHSQGKNDSTTKDHNSSALDTAIDRTKFWEPTGLTVKRLLVQQQGRSRLNTRFYLFTYEMMNVMCMCNSYHLYEVGINEPSNLSEADVQELKNS